MNEKIDFEKDINKIKIRIKIFNLFAWIFVLLGFVVLYLGYNFWESESGKLNEVGDFVGGVAGSFWALSGLFFIYIAFLGQKIEIKYQQEDLALTRDELMESRKVFKTQAEIMRNQQLDDTFFNLLDNHRRIVESLRTKKTKPFNLNFRYTRNSREIVSGYELLEQIYYDWDELFLMHSKYHKSKKIYDLRVSDIDPIELVALNDDVKLVFNELNNIIDFINIQIPENKKEFYFNVLSGSLSHYEKFLFDARGFISSKNHNLIFKNFDPNLYFNLKVKIPKLKFNKVNKEVNDDLFRAIGWERISYSSIKLEIRLESKVFLIKNNSIYKEKVSLEGYKSIDVDIVKDFNIHKFPKFFTSNTGSPDIGFIVLVITYQEFKYNFIYKVTKNARPSNYLHFSIQDLRSDNGRIDFIENLLANH
ncbi:hypothetical protein [Olleya sp. YS]|uniref:hypothetical protein n=1 Tax=Olleya sp. YS TaxID=3028318 RepID=UPI00243459A3|nr:hypothetical protein [Olleya sp. YS]WGD34235.1 hypothetical protein Ollyesu_10650 [Olleya sp. YS]